MAENLEHDVSSVLMETCEENGVEIEQEKLKDLEKSQVLCC